jgi:nucleoid-associated protein YgaU
MALNPVKVLLFLAGGSAAVGATAYVAGVFDPQRNPAIVDTAPVDQKLAALPPADAPSGQAEASGMPAGDTPAAEAPKPPASDAPAAATPAAPEQQAALPPAAGPPKTGAPAAAATNPQPAVEAPAFDLVRVEADGSIVIAGHAAPNAKVEAIIGSRVIGSAMAGPGGDFAIVLDEPLKPGDYQIVLRSTTADNVVAMSTETAVVSIPDSPDGQVLALVEEPGKPAQLITVPEPKQAMPSVASAPGDSGTPAAGSRTQASATPPATSDEKPAPEQQAAADAGASDQPAADTATKDQQADTAAKQQPAASEEKPAADTAATGQPAAPEQKPAVGGEQQVAVAAPDPAPAKPEQSASQTRVAVEAVEIEGRRIFVAGRADPGRTVRGYANEILLGDAKTSQEGRFLIEAERDLPVGDYIIRVDALGPDGAEVVARAAVPFEREAGDNVAAVAPPASRPTGETVASGTQDRVGSAPQAEAGEPAAKPSATAAVQDQPAAGAPTPSEKPAAIAAAPAASPASGEPARKPADASAAQPAPDKPAEVAATTTEQPAQSAAATDTAVKPADALSPKLQSVDGSVIIRRGDSLWRISHRVYGHGLRYSTIYLANQKQIDDPDRIYPGQVFSVPSKTEKGEEADMTRLGEQAVPPVVRQ